MRLILFAIFLTLSFNANVWAEGKPEPLKFERALSGDSFQASGKEIRIWGIKAPGEGHVLHFTATLYLETLLNKKEGLACKAMVDDTYQCYVGGIDIAHDLVRFGLAKDDNGLYTRDEIEAKGKSLGLWAFEDSQPL